jgi:hypothetical protein
MPQHTTGTQVLRSCCWMPVLPLTRAGYVLSDVAHDVFD